MAVAEDIVTGRTATRSGRLTQLLARGPLHVFLIVLTLLWMTPTFGLLITSFRDESATAESGWWTVFSQPRELTLEPYTRLLSDPDLVQALLNTAYITV
ncbi:MAG TPA: carbohydrate ABC transporter permease, partial [Actinomycetota bacterium]|nr:carbohydrate ABC transporter permease [Actinomycetota bacterium]